MTEFIKTHHDPALRSTESILTDIRFIAGKEVTRIKTYVSQGKPLSDRDSVHLRSLVQTLVLADTELRSAERHATTKLQALTEPELLELMKVQQGLLADKIE